MKWSIVPALVAVVVPGVASGQALSCAVPSAVPRPRPDLPTESQPVRRLPIGSYTLAISWSPEYCRNNADKPQARFQCGSRNRFDFVLHGLWPDGVGKDWPQYCHATPILPRQVIRRNLCSTPSAQLLQHEWAKHGTCMAGYTPQRYFAKSTSMYRALRFPDMDALSRQTLTAGALAEATLADIGICFLFAGNHHPAMKRITPIRRRIGRRTIFNLMGPLANPAHVTRQLIGIARPDYAPVYAEALTQLGTEAAFVVAGEEGLDEISGAGPTLVEAIGTASLPKRIAPEAQPESSLTISSRGKSPRDR